MTISSSLNAGVTGLQVNATRLATISDNIANSNTYGYKRAVSEFHSLVIDQSRGTYSAGGVRVTTGRDVSQRGTLITTNSATDLAIGGRGFFPVTPQTTLEGTTGAEEMVMTTTGSFKPDADGFLVTSGGLVLMGIAADQNGDIPTFARDTIGDLVPIRVEANRYEGDATTNINLGVNLPAAETKFGASGESIPMVLEYFGNLGERQNLNLTYTPQLPANAGDPATNRWIMRVEDDETGTLVGAFEVQFDDTFDNGGTIETITPQDETLVAAGPPPQYSYAPNPGAPYQYSAATGNITLDMPAPITAITLDVGKPQESRGLSQLSNVFAPVSITKDGSPVGNLASIEVDPNGNLFAIYDTGFTRRLYQIPVVDVPNPDGLQALPNQSYQISNESGAFYLWDAGDGPTGDVVGFSREESAVDVAGELTALIQTQRAYSSNAKVIQTVDEMLQETTNIKR